MYLVVPSFGVGWYDLFFLCELRKLGFFPKENEEVFALFHVLIFAVNCLAFFPLFLFPSLHRRFGFFGCCSSARGLMACSGLFSFSLPLPSLIRLVKRYPCSTLVASWTLAIMKKRSSVALCAVARSVLNDFARCVPSHNTKHEAALPLNTALHSLRFPEPLPMSQPPAIRETRKPV